MRFGSVCSGIEAASVAWNPFGWKAAWLAEIEPMPCSTLAHHYNDTPNFGDMTQFESWPDDEQHAIDLLCGGTPCQSFSVAGLRKGLDDARGNLMLTFASIAAKYRPKWLVWENVPGVLSSNAGRDFASFLGLLSGQSIEVPKEGWDNSGIIVGYNNAYSLAYRVLDAQYFGVAQRRKRVFVVGCLGANRCAAAVLFERQSLSGDTAPSRSKGQSVAGAITAGAFTGGSGGRPEGAAGNHFIPTVARCLTTSGGTKLDFETDTFIPSYGIAGNIIGRQPENGGNGNGFSEEISYTLTKTDQHCVVAPIAYAFDSLSSNSMKSSNPLSGCNETNIAKTIDTSGVNPSCNQGGNAVLQPIAWSEELTASVDCAGTMLSCKDSGGWSNSIDCAAGGYMQVTPSMQVRRLTPTECERLQGFPDGYTNVPHRGKPAADGNRYKALGNSWAVPVAAWVGERIQMVEDLEACK